MDPDEFRGRISRAVTKDEIYAVEADPDWPLALLEDPSLAEFLEENRLDIHLNDLAAWK